VAVDGVRDPLAALPETPEPILAGWLPPNDDPERPLMTLATIGQDGAPNARSVLLTEWSSEGFWFHTDARSRKVAELAANAAVALVLVWPQERRQLVVRGRAEPASSAEEAWAYRTRSAYLQQLAWQNTDEFAALPHTERVARWAAFAADHPDGFEEPATWVGYLVRPRRVTFWFGSPDTASRRVEYARTGSGDEAGWAVSLLAG